jgi:hypothetical protein
VLTPLLDAVPTTATVVSWTAAAYLPCYQPVPLVHGVAARVPRFAVGERPHLTLSTTGGGVLAGLSAGSRLVELPTFLRGDWAAPWGSVWAVVPDRELEPARVHTATRTRWGWSRDRVPSVASSLPGGQR